MDSAHHVIKRIFNPPFLSYMASHDAAGIVRPALLEGLVALTHLDLRGNSLTSVPAELVGDDG